MRLKLYSVGIVLDESVIKGEILVKWKTEKEIKYKVENIGKESLDNKVQKLVVERQERELVYSLKPRKIVP